jgi:hypothetical protein
MTVKELIDTGKFKVINEGDDLSAEITKVFCCDLLSVAMSRAPSGCAWVTVMGNMNTLAVASLTETACVIMAENTNMDDVGVQKAAQQGITLLKTDEPVFDAALSIHEMLG